MVQANELRLSNLVQTNQGVFKIYNFTHSLVKLEPFLSKEHHIRNIDEVYPISLIEEWLLKFGFRKTEYCFGLIKNFGKLRLTIFTDGCFKIETNDLPIEIKNVHQLQNLIFSLTGEELTISK